MRLPIVIIHVDPGIPIDVFDVVIVAFVAAWQWTFVFWEIGEKILDPSVELIQIFSCFM